jgi:hypothetical protein
MVEKEKDSDDEKQETDYEFEPWVRAAALAFDLGDPKGPFMHTYINHDLLWRPDGYDDKADQSFVLNYYQLFHARTSQRDPILATLTYLAQRKDYHWNEKCEMDEKDKQVWKETRQRIIAKYKTAERYLNRLRILLFHSGGDVFVQDYLPWIESMFAKT